MDASSIVLLTLFTAMLTSALLGPRRSRALRRLLGRLVVRVVARPLRRLRPERPAPPRPLGRPIELIARDVHRLGVGFRCVPAGMSFARFEGRRRAYDRVLIEACTALGIEHLLAVIPPGPELDRERHRVESLLVRAGMPLDDLL
jgi:hypothetical protein